MTMTPKSKAMRRTLVIALAAVALVGGYFVATFGMPRYEAYRFTGRVRGFEPASFRMHGVYVTGEKLPPDLALDRELEVAVDADTKFVKVAMVMPSEKEVMKAGGTFDPRKLVSTTAASSFEEMRGLLEGGPYFTLEVEFGENAIGQKLPTAAKVTYSPLIFSERMSGPLPQ